MNIMRRCLFLLVFFSASLAFGAYVEVDKNFDPGAVRKTGSTMTGPLIGTNASFSGDVYLGSMATDTTDLTGFVERTSSSLSWNNSTRTLTISGNHPVWQKGKRSVKTGGSIVVPAATATTYVYYNSSGALASSSTMWGINDGLVPVAIVYFDGTNGLYFDERHTCAIPKNVHKYLHTTIGARYASGFNAAFTGTGFTMSQGTFYDEDIEHTEAATTTMRVTWRVDGGSNWIVQPHQAKYFTEVADVIQYDASGTLTDVPANNFVAMWIYAWNDEPNHLVSVIGQRVDTTIANARANNVTPVITGLPTPEMKLLYRVILQRSGTSETYIETADFRNTSNLPVANYTPPDHAALLNLAYASAAHSDFAYINGSSSQAFAALSVTANATQSFMASTGTAALPAISFTTDPNTGFYETGADILGISTGGSGRGTFSSTGWISNTFIFSAGGASGTPAMGNVVTSLATPAFCFTGDINTGLGRSGEGTPCVITNGSAAHVWSPVSQGKTTYGNETTFSAASSSVVLAIDDGITEIPVASGQSIMFEARVQANESGTQSYAGFWLRTMATNYNGTLAICPTGSSIETFASGTAYGLSASVAGNVFRLIASGPNASLWRVNEIKYNLLDQ